MVPATLGLHFARSAGPASRVLEQVEWWVDPTTGTTFVGTRPPAVQDVSLEILDWNPLTQVATVSCDALVVPGTVLVDPRIERGRALTVRDVEQEFSNEKGSRALCWCSVNAVSPLSSPRCNALCGSSAGPTTCVIRRYRVVEASGGSNQWRPPGGFT